MIKKFKWYLRREFYKLEYKNKKILSYEETQKKIIELLSLDTPIMIARVGGYENEAMSQYLYKKNFNDFIKYHIKNNAGFFPVDDINLSNFSKKYLESLKNLDLLGISFNKNEGKIIREYSNNTILTERRFLDPLFLSENNYNWTKGLKNKKVLIISPFEREIKDQFIKMKKIFPNNEIEYEYELLTYKSVQSVGGNSNYKSWFEALEKMKDDITKLDFDISIIGAGAYGLPLASYIKKINKKSIHLGGFTQMLFGIKGKRWDNDLRFNKFYNEYWIRPYEKLEKFNKIEGGCYW